MYLTKTQTSILLRFHNKIEIKTRKTCFFKEKYFLLLKVVKHEKLRIERRSNGL